MLTGPEIAEKALASTVHLFVVNGGEPNSAKAVFIGSGFFITPESIVTCHHVIKDEMNKEETDLINRVITVPTEAITNGIGFTMNHVVSKVVQRRDPVIIEVDYNPISDGKVKDLAILKTIQTQRQPMSIGNSDAVKIGEPIYIAGTAVTYSINQPFETGHIFPYFTSGIISSIRFRNYPDGRKVERFVITAVSTNGSSGSALINNKGEVVGVICGSLSTPHRYSQKAPKISLQRLLTG